MAFSATLTAANGVATIALSGELDASTANDFKAEVEKASATPDLTRLVLEMSDLSYMASAGLRVLIFAKQRMGNVDIYLVNPQEMVRDTIEKTGFDQSAYIVDAIPE